MAIGKIGDFKRIMMLIASNEVAGLRRLIAAALKRGTSAQSIAKLIEKAIDGLYSPRGGFSQRELDIAFLVKAIGGPRLLYTLQKSHGLASASTIHRKHQIPRLLPSIGEPTPSEIGSNMSCLLDPKIKPPPPSYLGCIPGNVAAFDGIAIESKCRYCPKRNCIMGLCREHSYKVDTRVTSLESIENVRTALFTDKSVCFGSDATVVAIAPYARDDHYSPIPLIISPSDKTEKAEALARWIRVFLDTFREHEFGEKVVGPIWALASDGDSTFRRARHILCMVEPLNPDSQLGTKLSGMLGLNLFTSVEGITGTCDPKHIFKHLLNVALTYV